MTETELMIRLAVALGVGILIGIERGFDRDYAKGGSRLIAGVRTFALIGLSGGLIGVLTPHSPIVMAVGLFTIAALMMAARLAHPNAKRGVGLTTVMAGVVTYVLGVLAAQDQLLLAAAGGVVTAMLLNLKSGLHDFVTRIERVELAAFLRLLAISVLVLPVLPNQGMGPFAALNPFEIWLMVVLIAALSFGGYALVRVVGLRWGVPAAALAGGLVSSTAVSLSLARAAKQAPHNSAMFGAGIVLANTVIFPRVMVITSAVAPGLMSRLIWPMAGALIAGGLASIWLVRRAMSEPAAHPASQDEETPFRLHNPMDLRMAIQFGLILGVVILAVEAVRAWLGVSAILGVAGLSGLTDIDAITLTLARASTNDLGVSIAALGIVLACGSNSLVKWGLVLTAGPRELRGPVSLAMAIMMAGLVSATLIAESIVSS